MADKQIVLNMGMPFSGYLWVSRIISRLATSKNIRYKNSIAEPGTLIESLEAAIAAEGNHLINATEWDERLNDLVAKNWESVFVVYTIRDPRDLVFAFVESAKLSLEDAITLTQRSIEDFFRTYNAVDANVVLYEHVVQKPDVVIAALSNALEMPLIPMRARKLTRATMAAHNQAYTGASAEIHDAKALIDPELDVTGVNGSWRGYFNEEQQRSLEAGLAPFIKKLPYKMAFE